MVSMLGAIVLRDVPKNEARIDLVRYQIQGGFRGFGLVPPSVWHYVSVQSGGRHVGFWCHLEPQQVVVKVFDPTAGFQEADPEMEAQYQRLALSGNMGPALIGYPLARLGAWRGLVDKIRAEGFPPRLHQEEVGPGSRFDKILQGSHGGDKESLLAELQYAFVRWLVSANGGNEDEPAFNRWRHLVLSAYNAGEDRIQASGDLFPQMVDTLMRQYDLLPDSWFGGDSYLAGSQAGYMCGDMVDTGVPALVEKGKAMAAYLKKRGGGS
jgi:hypothetical protein